MFQVRHPWVVGRTGCACARDPLPSLGAVGRDRSLAPLSQPRTVGSGRDVHSQRQSGTGGIFTIIAITPSAMTRASSASVAGRRREGLVGVRSRRGTARDQHCVDRGLVRKTSAASSTVSRTGRRAAFVSSASRSLSVRALRANHRCERTGLSSGGDDSGGRVVGAMARTSPRVRARHDCSSRVLFQPRVDPFRFEPNDRRRRVRVGVRHLAAVISCRASAAYAAPSPR